MLLVPKSERVSSANSFPSPFIIQSFSSNASSNNCNPGQILQNEAFRLKPQPTKPSHTVRWFKARTRSSSKSSLPESFSLPRSQTPRKKHFIPAPYGTILKGKKLKQRYDIGGPFREHVDFAAFNAIIRNEFNMRTKYK
jgi:hypothetical protein